MKYSRVDDEILQKIKEIVHEKNILLSKFDLEPYSHDETTGYVSFPEVVVKVESVEQIVQILNLANEKKIPVTPRGGGTSLSGGPIPIYGGIVLSLEKMKRIIEIDTENLIAVVEPGVITGEFQREVQKYDLFYPVDPASLDSCMIGGNVATGCGGANAVKYGTIRDYVKGLEVVVGNGEIISFGGKIVKNSTGYQLMHLFIGSEGTLGIITKVILKLLPLPKFRVDFLVPFNDIASASKTVAEIIKNKIVPVALEFMEKDAIEVTKQFLNKEIPFPDAGAHLLISIDGNRKEEIEKVYEPVGEICLNNNALDVLISDTPSSQERIWEARRSISEAIKHVGKIAVREDIVVPRNKIPDFVLGVKEISKRYSVSIICFGHAGDGNVHTDILKKDMEEMRWREIFPKVVKELCMLGINLGGKISGEHGIGLSKKEYLGLNLSREEIELMKKVKMIFDPNNILNPGKIFDLT